MSAQHPASSTPFTGRLPLGTKPALVLVDLARAYFEPGAPLLLPSRSALESSARVLDVARRVAIPIVHTRVSYSSGGADGGYFYKKVEALSVFQAFNPLSETMAEVKPNADEIVVSKQYASAFFGTSLASTLHAQRVDTLLIVGVSTSGCVRATAVDAIQNGFIPVVVRDAVGDRELGTHENNLLDIQAKYGEVITEKEAAQYLRSGRITGQLG